MPWYFVGHKGIEKLTYGKRGRFAMDRYLEVLDPEVDEQDFWASIRLAPPEVQRYMSGVDKSKLYDEEEMKIR